MDSVFEKLKSYSAGGAKEVLKPSEKLLSDMANYGYNMSEIEKVLKTRGNQLVISCAGSGKTTALTFKVLYDLKSGYSTKVVEVNGSPLRIPAKIWVSTFLKTGAADLESSFRMWSNRLRTNDVSSAIQFSTLHAEYKRVLNSLGMKTDIVSDQSNTAMLKRVLASLGIKGENGRSLSSDEVSNFSGALTRSRNRLDKLRYESDIFTSMNLTAPIIDTILSSWKAERLKENKVDFEDLQEILYDRCYRLHDETVISALSNRFDFIYLDEFQDISQIQYELLKVYAQNAVVVAVGDDDQTIYSWRGSDNTIITSKFSEDFSPTRNNLSVNFRCPNVILDAVKPSIEKNKNRFDKNLKSFLNGGTVRVGEYANYRTMALSLGDLVMKDVSDGKSVAILCRVNSDGLLPAMFFDKAGRFTFSVSGSNMTFDSYIGRTVLSIVRMFTDRTSSDVKKALNLLTWDSYNINQLIEVCKTNNHTIWTIPEADLSYSCPSIADFILEVRDLRKEHGEIYALQFVLQYYRYYVFKKDTQFNDVMRSVLLSVESLLDTYNYTSVSEFLLDLDDMNLRLKAREKQRNSRVSIVTVHEFKGKDADSVYIWNDSADVFPHKKSITSLAELEEERRIHYIACTRARELSTIMYLRGKKGAFVCEMNLDKAVDVSSSDGETIGGIIRDNVKKDSGLSQFVKEVAVDTGELE